MQLWSLSILCSHSVCDVTSVPSERVRPSAVEQDSEELRGTFTFTTLYIYICVCVCVGFVEVLIQMLGFSEVNCYSIQECF